MAIKLEDAYAMRDAAKEHGVVLACIFQNHYNAGTLFVKDLLRKGELGKIRAAKCFVTWNRSDDYYGGSDWKGTWDKEGGGVLIDQAIHTLDMMRDLVGEEIESIEATTAKRGHAKIEVEDTAEGVIRFQSGLLANFHAINYYSYDANVEIELDCEKARVNIVSDKATVDFRDGRVFTADRDPNEVFDYGKVKSYWGVNHSRQIENFYECLETGAEMFIPLESALKTQEMICAIYESGREHKRVYLNK